MLVQSGIAQPFEVLYETYTPAMTRYLARLTGSYEAAEDLAQDTFLKVIGHWEQGAVVANQGAWLFRIATNTAYDALRYQQRRLSTPLTALHAQTLTVVPAGLSYEDADLLWVAVGRLPDYYRVPLLLQGYAGYTASDIAALLGWNLSTVKSRIRRARMQFKTLYTA